MTYTVDTHRSLQQKVQLQGGNLAYIDQGQGPVILLVHGVPTSSWLYRKIIPELVKQGHRVIAPDLLGYGNSDKPKGYEIYNPQFQGKRLLELMRHLDIKSWTHVCHDVGGLWTWQMIAQGDKEVKKLVLLNTIMYEEGFKPPMRFEQGQWGKFYTGMYRSPLTGKAMMKATMNNGVEECEFSKEDLKGYWLPMREGGNRAIYHFFTQTCFELPDHEPILKKLDVPTIVIWGKGDKILQWEPQASRVMRDLGIAAPNVHILEGTKHFIQEDKPIEVAKLIGDFA